MKTLLYLGAAILVTAPNGGLVGGTYYRSGMIEGIVQDTVAQGAQTVVHREGAHQVVKATGSAWGLGDTIYWDAGNSRFTNVNAEGLIPVGAAVPDASGVMAASADTSGVLLLDTKAQRVVCGQHTTAAAVDTIVTGLTKVVSAFASLDSDPVDDPEWVTASIGDQAGSPAAGSILLKTWKNTGGTDPSPLAATTFAKKVNWIAVGY